MIVYNSLKPLKELRKLLKKRDYNNSHLKRCVRLASCGSGEGHDCFLKGITVNILLDYPVYWSPQFTKISFLLIFVSSSSSMHTIMKTRF